MHEEGDLLGRDSEILKLQFLFKHLEEIRGNDKASYRRACKLLRRARNEDQYFGARMEIYTAASLIRKNVEFKCRESPDYELLGEFSGLFVECGSAHIKGSNLDIVKKINLTVINKCKKPYANRSTMLMLDMTNIYFHGLFVKEHITIDDVRFAITSAIATSGYGSVLLLSYGLNEGSTKIFSNFIRVDSIDISKKLEKFVNIMYPIGGSFEQPTYYTSQS